MDDAEELRGDLVLEIERALEKHSWSHRERRGQDSPEDQKQGPERSEKVQQDTAGDKECRSWSLSGSPFSIIAGSYLWDPA
jgi:hypothetical protein